jgi:hypothetical protein
MKLFKKIFWTLVFGGATIFWAIDLVNLSKGIMPDDVSIFLAFIVTISTMSKLLIDELCK